ncbi:MAG TPA: hypothetical protein VG935_00865 [Patescibacteria group bacterium]|nr:hypothetical protein [Patescibacteria group bacterium]
MNKINLREVAKFLAGLITGDFLVGLWWMSTGNLPMNFLGWRLSNQTVSWWMAFDAILIAFLVYYAWVRKTKKRK